MIKNKYLLTILLTVIVSISFLYLETDISVIYLISALFPFLILITGDLINNDEERATNFFLTLPISKNTFVLSKYVSCFAIGILSWLTTSIVLILCLLLPFHPQINGSSILAGLNWSLGLITFSVSFILVVYYKWGYNTTRLLIVIIFILFSFSSQIIQSNFFQNLLVNLSQYSQLTLSLLFLMISLVIFALSCVLALMIIKRKSF